MPLQPNQFALFSTVALLVVTAYFLLGSIPLLTLRHDTTLDARFIRSFYVTYYRFALVTATGATISYAMASRPVFAVGAAAIVVVTLLLRRHYLPKMDALGVQMGDDATAAIPAFRRIHQRAILINLAQLLGILGSLTAL
ncbi:hypothetical protein [Hydrogenophaga sp.]|uniref:hypothetical protein n=1 Tax=Hydrogenophaga sp. TaxID=1904254 RepID=UPI0035AE8672